MSHPPLILHSADWHIDVKRKFKEHVDALTWMIVTGIERGVQLFLFAGDFAGLDAPHHLRTKEILALIKLFSLAATAAPTVVIPGNHDETEQFQIFEHLSLGENFHLCRQPTTEKIEVAGSLYAIRALPWLGRKTIYGYGEKLFTGKIENEETSRILTSLALNDVADGHLGRNILVSHYPVAGAVMGQVEVNSKHDTVLDVEALEDRFAYIALGHLHRRQSVRTRNPIRRAWYSGSPVPIDFSETSRRGCNLVIPGKDGPRVQFLPIPSWRMETVSLDDSTFPSGLASDYRGAYVRANVTIPSSGRFLKQQKFFKDIEVEIMKRGAFGVKINRLPAVTPERPPPTFMQERTLDDQIERVMDGKDYDRHTRERIHTALRSVREYRRTLAA